ncbi:purine-cytosine permease family protein [Streptomyces spongiae]|uniref:Permease n=1 Tax=Streptomyces spongiae TaxID=565072 RepID=A0A5N8X8W9_9ACTN|nr:permease [Streptomyces spongiae]MPY55883.1 permease [Streptomyces spongiae]
MALATALFGAVNMVLARYAAKSGLSVAMRSRRLFGYVGATLAPLILGATCLYYAVFEGSVIAVTFQHYFAPNSDIRIWYAVCVLYAIPLALGGVQRWLDRLNGWLLPLYVIGMIALVVTAGTQHGFHGRFLSVAAPAATGDLPGWLYAFCIYLGLSVMMMSTVDFARFGRTSDSRFHGLVTFGPVFYVATFMGNGLIGLFVMEAVFPGQLASETGIVDAVLNTLGFAGLLLIFVSQTRINTANYFLASSNLDAVAAQVLRIQWPRFVWVLVTGALTYVFMLTNVLSYLLTALAWQGVFVVAWVGVMLAHLAHDRDGKSDTPEFRPGRLSRFSVGLVAWLVPSVTGILITEYGAPGAWYTQGVLIGVFALSWVLYTATARWGRSPVLQRGDDPRDEVTDPWTTMIRCHRCKRYNTAIEVDRDPTAEDAAICASCAEGSTDFRKAALAQSRKDTSAPAATSPA